MERILSQDEINALFSSKYSGGQVLGRQAENSAETCPSAAKYDFCRSGRISKDQIRSIHILHSYFARNLSSSLSACLRSMAEVSLVSMDQISCMDFLRRLSDPTLFCALTLRPMHGSVALKISPGVGFPMIDILLGGPGNPASGYRPLTKIEMNIMEIVVRLILRDMKGAWHPIPEIDPRLQGSDIKPQMLQIVVPGEPAIAIGFEIKLGGNTGMLLVCLPSMMLRIGRTRFDRSCREPRTPRAGKRRRPTNKGKVPLLDNVIR